MSAACEHADVHLRFRARRIPGTSRMRVVAVEECGRCGAVGTVLVEKPPPEKVRPTGQGGPEVIAKPAVPNPDVAPTPRQVVRSISWLLMSPAERRWGWRVVPGGRR
jgi:hypothetical protein